jgi:hypothetical protein
VARLVTAPKAKPKPAKPTLPPTQEKPVTNPYGIDTRALPYVQPSLNLIQSQEDSQKKALSDFTSAVLSQLAQIGPQVGQDYNQAIGQSQALAQAGADSLKGANGDAGIQSLLNAAGAPTRRSRWSRRGSATCSTVARRRCSVIRACFRGSS